MHATARTADASADPILHAADVRRGFGSGPGARLALDGVSIEVARGEYVAIVGPSGSGKSTLLSILGGLDLAFDGTVRLLGRSVRDLPDAELSALRGRAVGFVFQAFHLLPHLTLLENVELPALFGPKVVDARERARAALARVGMIDRAADLPASLSGGQRQRVAIARAILVDPPVLLCDEPTGNLDAESGGAVVALLRDLHARAGTTVVVVTHEDRTAAAAGRTVRLRDGRIASGGDGAGR